MRDKFLQLKTWVVEDVLQAEKELRGKSGAEKKKAVAANLTAKLTSVVKLPWYANWAKGIVAPRLVEYLVDLACGKLNFLSNWDFADAELGSVQVEELASVLAAPTSVVAAANRGNINERIDELYLKYGITPDTNDTSNTPNTLLPKTANNDNQLSKNLARREVACRCGCGFDIVVPELVETFQVIRDFIGQPIHITSGCRCPERNAAVGGVVNSAHVLGQALDMQITGLSARQFGEMIKQAYREGLLMHLRYCYLMSNAVHVGTDERQRNGMWGW